MRKLAIGAIILVAIVVVFALALPHLIDVNQCFTPAIGGLSVIGVVGERD